MIPLTLDALGATVTALAAGAVASRAADHGAQGLGDWCKRLASSVVCIIASCSL
jgi:hypothetical protein